MTYDKTKALADLRVASHPQGATGGYPFTEWRDASNRLRTFLESLPDKGLSGEERVVLPPHWAWAGRRHGRSSHTPSVYNHDPDECVVPNCSSCDEFESHTPSEKVQEAVDEPCDLCEVAPVDCPGGNPWSNVGHAVNEYEDGHTMDMDVPSSEPCLRQLQARYATLLSATRPDEVREALDSIRSLLSRFDGYDCGCIQSEGDLFPHDEDCPHVVAEEIGIVLASLSPDPQGEKR